MEPFNARLQQVIEIRWAGLPRDEKDCVISWLATERPALVVRAMDYAQRLAAEVDETLLA
jgi:hypothetical protein